MPQSTYQQPREQHQLDVQKQLGQLRTQVGISLIPVSNSRALVSRLLPLSNYRNYRCHSVTQQICCTAQKLLEDANASPTAKLSVPKRTLPPEAAAFEAERQRAAAARFQRTRTPPYMRRLASPSRPDARGPTDNVPIRMNAAAILRELKFYKRREQQLVQQCAPTRVIICAVALSVSVCTSCLRLLTCFSFL